MRNLAMGLGTLALSLSMTACTGSGAKEDPAAAAGYGDAVLALMTQSDDGFYQTSLMRGSVILVDTDGTFRAIENAGMNNGRVSLHDGTLHVSDVEADYRITSSSIERSGRATKKYAQETALATPFGNMTVFNDGAGKDGDYHSGVIIDDGDAPVTGSINGELWSVQTCGENVIVLVSSWQDNGADLRLVKLSVVDSRLEQQRLVDVELPKGGPDSAALMCAGDRPVVLQDRGPKKVDFLGVFTDADQAWTEIEVGGDPDWGVAGCGSDGGLLFLMDTHARRMTRVEVDGAQVSHFIDLPSPHGVSSEYVEFGCKYERGLLQIDVQDGAYSDPTYYWYDSEGNLQRELTVDGLGNFLRKNGESVSDAGVVIDAAELLETPPVDGARPGAEHA